MTQLAKCLRFDLTDSLTGYIEFISDVHETQGALNRVIAADTTYPLERIRKEFAPLKDCLR